MTFKPFFQQEKLTTRIKNILDEYPEGVGIFKEFIQNADDAKAKDFAIIFDNNNYETEGLLSEGLKEWQGPALYFYNSSTFSQKDFESISSVGQSGKINDEMTIGKYGLGFNCCYHFTDVVSFISDDQIVFFDPHSEYLPEKLMGIKANFVELKKEYPNQFSPFIFDEFSINMDEPINGTLFRIPLRNSTKAEKSLLANHYYNEDDIMKMFSEFSELSTSMILFLKYLQNIKIYLRDRDRKLELIHSVSISNISENLIRSKLFFNLYMENQSDLILSDHWVRSLQLDHYLLELKINTKMPNEKEERERKEKWYISAIITTNGVDIKNTPLNQSNKYQWGNIAAPLHCLQQNQNKNSLEDFKNKSGKIYCSLPLPIESPFPVHINGNFSLTSNRRHLWSGNDMIGAGAFKAEWNRFLLEELLPRAYSSLLSEMTSSLSEFRSDRFLGDFYSLWPCLPSSSDLPFDSFFSFLSSRTLQILYENEAKVVWSHNLRRWSSLLHISYFHSDLPTYLSPIFKKLDLNVVELPKYLIDYLSAHLPNRVCTPSFLIAFMKKKDKLGLSALDADLLLFYLLTESAAASSSSSSYHKKKQFIHSLIGLKLIPLQNSKLASFQHSHHQNIIYYCETKQQAEMLAGVGNIVDYNSKCYPIISSDYIFTSELNLRKITPKVLPQFITQILPNEWKGHTRVKLTITDKGNDKLFRGNRGEMIHAFTSQQLNQLISTIRDLWEFILLSPIIPRFENFPMVLVQSAGNLSMISIDSLSKGIFREGSFEEVEKEVLGRLGVEFIHAHCDRLLDLVKFPNTDLIAFLSKGNIPLDDAPLIRSILYKSLSMGTSSRILKDTRHIDTLRLLPIFLSKSGKLQPISGGSVYNRAHIFPSLWSHLSLLPLPLDRVDLDDPTNQFFLSLLPPEKVDDILYLKDVLIHLLRYLPLDDILMILQMLSKTSILQENRSKFFHPIIDALKTNPIVVFPDGRRSLVSDVIDPSELPDLFLPQFNSSLTSNNKNNKNKNNNNNNNNNINNNNNNNERGRDYLPEEYIRYTKIMKMIGLRSIGEFDNFVVLARTAAANRNVEHAKQLINYILLKQPKWSSSQYLLISQLELIPTYDLTHLTRFRQLKEILDSSDPSLLSRFETLSPSSQCCFRDDAIFGFTQLKLFDSSSSQISNRLKTTLGIQSPVPIDLMVSFIEKYIGAHAEEIESDEIEQTHYRRFLYCFFHSLAGLKKSKSKLLSIRRQIGHLRFILRENNELAEAGRFSEDLTVDFGRHHFAIPPFLLPFSHVFSKLRDPVDFSLSPPSLSLSPLPSPSSLLSFIFTQSKGNQLFADVTLHCCGRLFPGHKLLLYHSSEFFKRAFTSGMIESTLQKIDLQMPDWMDLSAFEIAYEFLYSHSLTHLSVLKKNQNNANLVCDLLRCSDYLELIHLKEWCEVYLSELDTDVFYFIELFLLAVDTNAKQLQCFASYQINVKFDLISHSEQWLSLPQPLKHQILTFKSHPL